MSTNLSDVSVASPPPPPADSTGEAAPSAAIEEQASSQTAGSDTAGTDADRESQASGSAAPSANVPDYLKDFPSMEELEQNKSERYAQALLGLRPAHDALLQKHRDLEPLAQFKDVVSNSTPEQLQTKLAIVDGFFSPLLDGQGNQVYENGLPLTTATPGLERLIQESPNAIFDILNDAFPLKVGNGTIEDSVMLYLFQKHGLNPQNLKQYAEWEKTGAPVANNSVDLSNIPQAYQAVVKNLPARVQADYAALSQSDNPDDKELLQHYLDRDKRDFDAQAVQTQAREQQARETEARIQQNTQTAIQGKFETGFNQFLQHLSPWQPTSDEKINRAYHIETANTLVNLLDPNMKFANDLLYETIGMQPDAEIPTLNQQFQSQTSLVELYRARGETFKAAEAQRSADNAYMRLVAKLNGVAGKLIEYKTKVAEGQQAAAQAGQPGRTHVTGQPGAQSPNGGRNGNWLKAYYD